MKNAALILLLAVLIAMGCDRNETEPTNIADAADVVTMDPNEILFTTPTLNDAIPATEQGSTVPADSIQLHEDDWRQFELVPRKLKTDVDAELADINAIWENHSVPLGESGTAFREVHVRKRIPKALAIPMTLSDFAAFVGQDPRRMTFFGYGEPLSNVHVAKVDNLIIYAHIENGAVTAMGFDVTEQFSLPEDFANRLRDFVRDHDLLLIHWRSRTLFESNDDVLQYFGISG